MSLPRQVEKVLRQLAALPHPFDDLGPADYAVVESCIIDARGEVARLDRAAGRKAEVEARRVKPVKRAKRWTADPSELRDAKQVVWARSGGRCEANTPVCDLMAVHVHHRALRKAKGCHAPDLLLAVCEPCHRRIHDQPEQSYAAGWLIRSGALAPVVNTKGNR